MTNEENIKDNALISPSVSLQYVIWEIEWRVVSCQRDKVKILTGFDLV
jgi:hypothetical protein